MIVVSNSPLLSPAQKLAVLLVSTFDRIFALLNRDVLHAMAFIGFISLLLCTSKLIKSKRLDSFFLPSFAVLFLAIIIASPWTKEHTEMAIKDNYYEPWIALENFTLRYAQPRYYSDGTWYDDVNKSSVFRFRGINLPAKTPNYPHDLRSTTPSSRLNHSYEEYMKLLYSTKDSISFVDRPLPLSTADEHFARLSLYGFNLLRLSVPWEVRR